MVYNYVLIDWKSSHVVNNDKNHIVFLDGEDFVGELERSSITTLYTYPFEHEDPITGHLSNFPISTMFLFERECTVYFCDLDTFTSVEQYKDALEKGFLSNYYKIEEFVSNNSEYDYGGHTPEQFYVEALENGYEEAKSFLKSLKFFSGGVKPRPLYLNELEVAKKGGFRTKLDMEYAKSRGFQKQGDFDEARHLGILNQRDYVSYCVLQYVMYEKDFETMDRAHLYVLLNQRRDEIKKVRKIYDEMKRHGIPNGGKVWYTVGLNTMDDAISFLTNNPHCTKLGNYDTSSETFENLKAKTIYVDGNNVARRGGTVWNTDIGQVRFLEMVMGQLKKIFEEVKVFCDANILFKVDDKSKIRELEKSGILTIVPTRSVADEWLDIWTRDHDNYIVTNDNFEEWVEEFPELEERLVKFLATDNEVRISQKNLKRIKKHIGISYENFNGFVYYGTWSNPYADREINIPLSLHRINP